MEQTELRELLILERRRYQLLSEVSDLTIQLAEARDRRDEVSFRMLLSMRQEPIQKLQRLMECLPPDRRSLSPVAPPPVAANAAFPEETLLADQTASNRRALAKILELDERISQMTCGERSHYTTKNKQ